MPRKKRVIPAKRRRRKSGPKVSEPLPSVQVPSNYQEAFGTILSGTVTDAQLEAMFKMFFPACWKRGWMP